MERIKIFHDTVVFLCGSNDEEVQNTLRDQEQDRGYQNRSWTVQTLSIRRI